MPMLVADGWEAAPQRAVLEQAMTIELAAEQRLAIGNRLVFGRPVEASLLPCLFRAFDDERRMRFVVLIGVDAEQAVRAFLEIEGESGKRPGRAEPDELVAPVLDLRLEVRGVFLADRRIGAVGGQH